MVDGPATLAQVRRQRLWMVLKVTLALAIFNMTRLRAASLNLCDILSLSGPR